MTKGQYDNRSDGRGCTRGQEFLSDLGRAESGWPACSTRWSVDERGRPRPFPARPGRPQGWCSLTGGAWARPAWWAGTSPGPMATGWPRVGCLHCVAPCRGGTGTRPAGSAPSATAGTSCCPLTLPGCGSLSTSPGDDQGHGAPERPPAPGAPGGYLPFSYEVTDFLVEGHNLLAVLVDASFTINVRPTCPPGPNVEHRLLRTGGIYREVCLRPCPRSS